MALPQLHKPAAEYYSTTVRTIATGSHMANSGGCTVASTSEGVFCQSGSGSSFPSVPIRLKVGALRSRLPVDQRSGYEPGFTDVARARLL